MNYKWKVFQKLNLNLKHLLMKQYKLQQLNNN